MWMPYDSGPALRSRAGALVGFCLLGLIAGPAVPASAESRSIAVLSISSDDDDSAASALTAAMRSEAAADDTLRPSNSRASLSQMTIAQDCEITDPHCRARIAAALSVQLVIYGEVRRLHGDFEAELHMFGDDGAQVSATRQIPARDVARKDLAAHAHALLRELLGGPDETSETPTPSTKPVVTPTVAPLDDTEPREPNDEVSHASNDWVGYTLLGVAAVSVGLTVFSWTQIGAANDDESLNEYRKAVGTASPSVADACDEAKSGRTHGVSAKVLGEARDACGTGRTFETLQYVFLGSALVAAGIGTYFLLDDEGTHDSSAARIRVHPEMGLHSASLRVSLDL